MRRASLLLLAATILITGCVEDIRPADETCEASAIEQELTLTDEALVPNDPAACRDQEVTLVVESEVDGVLHIHGYDSEVPAFEVRGGEVTRITFEAGRSGQFPIELHAEDDPRGVGVGVFTVHEP